MDKIPVFKHTWCSYSYKSLPLTLLLPCHFWTQLVSLWLMTYGFGKSVCVWVCMRSTEGSQAHPAHGHACASTEPHKLQWEPWEVKQGEVTKRARWPIPCKHRLPWEHIDYLTIWMEPVPCTCQGSVGCFVALLSRGSAAKWVLCGAMPPGHWYTSAVMLRDKRQTHSLNWQKSKMMDWWIRDYYEQMGEWDEGVRERKHCSGWIFITPGGQ